MSIARPVMLEVNTRERPQAVMPAMQMMMLMEANMARIVAHVTIQAGGLQRISTILVFHLPAHIKVSPVRAVTRMGVTRVPRKLVRHAITSQHIMPVYSGIRVMIAIIPLPGSLQ